MAADKTIEDFFGPNPMDTTKIREELQPYLEETPFGRMLKHPLIVDLIPLWKVVNERYDFKVNALKVALASSDWGAAIWLHERPFRLEALANLFMEGHIDEKTLSQLLPSVWTDAEPADELAWEWLFQAAEFVTDNPERAYHLRGRFIQLWRGGSKGDEIGLAWSLQRKTAEFFAKRFDEPNPVIYEGLADFNDAYAFITLRGEEEVVISPTKVSVVGVDVA